MDHLTQMRVYATVVERESFTDAARVLGIAKSSVSRYVAELEERLGVRLLNRTTRKLAPTDLGRAYYERAARVLADAEEADRMLTDCGQKARGVLRITAQPFFATRYLSCRVAHYLAENPEVRVELHADDRLVDVVEEGFDLAVRIGALTDSSLVARKLGPSWRILVASPGYVERSGAPGSPGDLVDHECILHVHHRDPWRFEGPDGPVDVTVSGRFSADHGDLLVRALVEGAGIGFVPDFMVKEHLASGALVPLLPDWLPAPRAVHVLYPHRRLLAPRVRLFVDALVAAWADDPPWVWRPPAVAAAS